MSNLAREFADVIGFVPKRLAHMHKYRKLIADKKLELDPLKIISLDEFGLKVILPIMASSNSFSHLFSVYGDEAHNILVRWLVEEDIEPFWLEHDQVTSDVLQFGHDNFYDYEFEQRFLQEQDAWKFYGTYSDERAQAYREDNRIKRFPELLRPAAYLQDIVGALDAAACQDNVLKDCEATALYKGQGDVALQFWMAVDDIKDYSGFFPNKRPPSNRNNKRKDGVREKPKKNWLDGLRPGLGGAQPGLQPI